MESSSLSSSRSTASDAELVATVVSGDIEAFGALLGRHRDPCWRFALRMLGNHDDAEDALQEAFVRSYRNLGACREPARFGAWLYRIVVNECRTRAIRRHARERRFVSDESAEAPVPPAADVEALREEIGRALALLVPEQREAFILKYVEDKSYDEMAEVTGVGISALKMRVKRGCERLRELLEGVVT